MELEVVWNGSHESRDADLLCCPAIPEKRYDVPLPSFVVEDGVSRPRKARAKPKAAYGAISSTILAALHYRPLSGREVSEATGFLYEQIKHALLRLRRAGIITRQRASVEERRDGAPRIRYRLVKG